jgi:calcineurin-like phosphoesterase family protein
MSRIFFTSDTHFGHTKIIEYCKRPFSSVEEMDALMIESWNMTVDDRDTVYHLGDFTLGNAERAEKYFKKLTGHIRVLGNPWHHDALWLGKNQTYYTASNYEVEILPPMVCRKFMKHWFHLSHYPLAVWDRKHYGSIHLHGHSHGSYKAPQGGRILDVGVDTNNFSPVPLEWIVTEMEATHVHALDRRVVGRPDETLPEEL